MFVFQVGVVAHCSLVVIQDTIHVLDCNSYMYCASMTAKLTFLSVELFVPYTKLLEADLKLAILEIDNVEL